AQTEGTRELTWHITPANSGPGQVSSAVPSFAEASFFEREEIPYYVFTISGAEVSSLEFTQTEFAPLTPTEARAFHKNDLPAQLIPTIGTGMANRVPMSTIHFKPFRINPQTGAPEKLVKFSYRYRTGNSAQR